MAFDAFLKLTDCKGESHDKAHKDEIEIDSFSWGAVQEGSSSYGGGAGAGKVHMSDFTFTKKVDKSTPTLFIRCADGKHLSEAILTLRKAGGEQKEYLKVKFKNVIVSSIQQSGQAGGGMDIPVEHIALNFEEVKYEYKMQDASGNLVAGGEFGYNLKNMAPA